MVSLRLRLALVCLLSACAPEGTSPAPVMVADSAAPVARRDAAMTQGSDLPTAQGGAGGTSPPGPDAAVTQDAASSGPLPPDGGAPVSPPSERPPAVTNGSPFLFGAGLPDGDPMPSHIFTVKFDATTGNMMVVDKILGLSNITYGAVDPQGTFLVATTETFPMGRLMSFAIDKSNGKLTNLSTQPTKGGGAVFVTFDKTGRFALVANFGGGVSVLPIGKDGALGDATKYDTAGGTHSVRLDPSNRFAYAPHMTSDKIFQFTFDEKTGALKPHPKGEITFGKRSGPRHMDFHPSGKWAYVVNEVSNEVDTYAIEADGGLKRLQTVSTLPPEFKASNTAAAIAVTPSGKFLFASNRGHNSVAQFKIDGTTGMLAANGHTTEQVNTPRCFTLDASGQYLILAKQMSGNLIGYRIQDDGTLKFVKAVHLGRSAPWVGAALLPL